MLSADRYAWRYFTNGYSIKMPAIPDWALALIFWIHFLAAVTLVGSLVATSILVLPAAQALDPLDQLRSDRQHPKANGTSGMVQPKSADRDRLVSDERQHSLQRFSFCKQPMDDCHPGETHSGGSVDRGQRDTVLGCPANHPPLVDAKGQSQPGRGFEITKPRSLAVARRI